MRRYKLFLADSDSTERILITLPQKLSTLAQPLNLNREKGEDIEADSRFKKKSEIIEQEEETYKELKEREKDPYILTDSEHKSFLGRLQDTKSQVEDVEDEDCYYTFLNIGDAFSVMPVNEWYRFTNKGGYEMLTLEQAELKLCKKNGEDKKIIRIKEDNKDIDYEETFDDDEAEDEVNFINEDDEKELDNAGEALKKLVSNYEKESSEEMENEREFKKEIEKDKNKEKGGNNLNDEKLKQCFITMPMSVKDFLNEVRKNFNIEGVNKDFIRDFIKRNCVHKKDKDTNEKILFLNDSIGPNSQY